MTPNDSQWLDAFSKGDEKAFEQLFEAYYEQTCRYVLKIIRDRDTSEEIVQSTFVNLWEKREMMRPDITFKSYLFRSAYNNALNFLKHKKVVASHVAYKQNRIEELKREAISLQPDFEIQQRITEAMEQLPPQCQRVFKMSREEGLKYHEIADELGISKKTVEVHMGKALKILREHLSDYLLGFLFLTLFT